VRYIASFERNGKGLATQLFSDHQRSLDSFAERENKNGRNIYDCVAELVPGAQVTRERSLDTVASLDIVHVDVDLKDLKETREAALAVLTSLALRLEIRDSGGGLHVIAKLKEPAEAGTKEFDRVNAVRRRLTHLLGGDPAPDHAAALLRRVGTHNHKFDPPRLCHVIQEGEPVDITELEAMAELYERPLLTRKTLVPKTNGHDPAAATVVHLAIDVDTALAAMRHQGGGDTSIHSTSLRTSAALLRQGLQVDVVVSRVLAAVRAAVADDPAWDWKKEERDISRMCFDWINKNPEMISQAPEALQLQWRAKEAAGYRCIKIVYSGFNGGQWCANGRKPTDSGDGASAPQPGSDGPPDKPADAPREKAEDRKGKAEDRKVRAIPFRAFDEAAEPRRVHLLGKHYQRGQCTPPSALTARASPRWGSAKLSSWQRAATCSASSRRSVAACGYTMPMMTRTKSVCALRPSAACTMCR
jgi:hypothetical protein